MSINIFSILSGKSDDLIPARDPGAVSASKFLQDNLNLVGAQRETHILHEFLAGNVPNFLRKLHSVDITHGADKITYLVMSDYLSLGTDQDYARIPMNPHTAQSIANQYDCTLPTRKMVNDIWKSATNKLVPLTWGPPYDSSMMSTNRIIVQNKKIQNQLSGKDNTALTAGHQKDVILSETLFPNNPKKRVCIYGWIKVDGTPIQQLNDFSHEDTYADYSHGIRLIANDVIVNGNPMRIQDVFLDTKLSALVSDQGILSFQKY